MAVRIVPDRLKTIVFLNAQKLLNCDPSAHGGIGDHLALGEGFFYVYDTLIGGAAELQADIVQLLHELAVYQHIYQREHFFGTFAPCAAFAEQLFVEQIARVAPHVLLRI